MTTTRLVELSDGCALLETFDFRSEFAFDEFAEWISRMLQARPKNGTIGEDMEPFSFDWEGTTFEAAWSDEHGCFVKAPPGSTRQLRNLQTALAA